MNARFCDLAIWPALSLVVLISSGLSCGWSELGLVGLKGLRPHVKWLQQEHLGHMFSASSRLTHIVHITTGFQEQQERAIPNTQVLFKILLVSCL